MDKRLERLFSSELGKKIYSSAAAFVDEHSMRDRLIGGTLVGLSGGADSVMLLLFLLEYSRREGDFKILAFHLNHSIRGEEADADEEFSRRLCESLGVEFISRKLDIPTLARERGIGTEECAREARYSEFAEIISGRDDLATIAVAHNSDDNAETVLLNILRGAGTRGAAGIPPVRDNIVRPLLLASKADILEALSLAELPFVTDSTNLESDYKRNFIRNEIMPRIRMISDNPEEAFARFSENLRSDEEYLDSAAEELLRGRAELENGELRSLPRPIFSRVLKKMRGAPLTALAVKEIAALLPKDNFSYTLGGGSTFICERGVCRISTQKELSDREYCYPLRFGKTEIPEYCADFILSREPLDKTSLNVYKISIQANISSAIIVDELYLRPRREGDSVFYGKMTHKLKKLYNDRKIPRSKRSLIPVLCDGKGVVWAAGFGARDDGASGKEPLYVTLGITDGQALERFYSAREFGVIKSLKKDNNI